MNTRPSFASFSTASLSEQRVPSRQKGSLAADRDERGLRVWQDALIDFMLLNPSAARTDLARKFEVTEAHITHVMKSDSFQRELASRRASLTAAVERTISERLHGLFHRSVDKMEKQLELDSNISHGEVRETMKSALDGLGYSSGGASRGENKAQNTVNILITKEDLEVARGSIRRLRVVGGEEDSSSLPLANASTR